MTKAEAKKLVVEFAAELLADSYSPDTRPALAALRKPTPDTIEITHLVIGPGVDK